MEMDGFTFLGYIQVEALNNVAYTRLDNLSLNVVDTLPPKVILRRESTPPGMTSKNKNDPQIGLKMVPF